MLGLGHFFPSFMHPPAALDADARQLQKSKDLAWHALEALLNDRREEAEKWRRHFVASFRPAEVREILKMKEKLESRNLKTDTAEGANKELIQRLHDSAAEGVPGAQYFLACCYHLGFAVPSSLSKALELYHDAAKQGHVSALVTLALLYEAKAQTRESSPEYHAADLLDPAATEPGNSSPLQMRLAAQKLLLTAAEEGEEYAMLHFAVHYMFPGMPSAAKPRAATGLVASVAEAGPTELSNALIWFLQADHVAAVEELFQHGKVDHNSILTPDGVTPLLYAASLNRLESLAFLLSPASLLNISSVPSSSSSSFSNPNPDASSHKSGITALALAASRGHKEVHLPLQRYPYQSVPTVLPLSTMNIHVHFYLEGVSEH